MKVGDKVQINCEHYLELSSKYKQKLNINFCSIGIITKVHNNNTCSINWNGLDGGWWKRNQIIIINKAKHPLTNIFEYD